MTEQEIIDVLYPYYLERQIKHRDNIITIFERGDFTDIRHNSYFKFTRVQTILKHSKLNELIDELIQLRDNLPEHAFDVEVNGDIRDWHGNFFDEDNRHIVLSYKIGRIVDADQCERSALSTAKHYAWKILHQPNSNEAKLGMERYNKLTTKTE